MKRLFFLPLLIIIQINSYAQSYIGSFEFEGRTRNYEVYLPAELKENLPLILSLHGYSEGFKWYRDYTQLYASTDTAGYILVCPQAAINLTWNIGILEDPDGIRDFSKVKDVNDVGFISTLIDTICKNYSIDMERIYCCGFSTGGEMSLVLACRLGQRFAAVASVAGGLYNPAASWNPCKPMPVLEIHGTSESTYSPYDGRGSMWSVAKTLNYWVERNKIIDPPDTILIPDIVTSDNCTVEKISYLGGLNESEVIHYKVIGGGHSWPGSATTFNTEGNKNRDINANVEILNFFRDFQNPLANLTYCNNIKLNPTYLCCDEDTLNLIAQLDNPEDHSADVLAYIEAENSDYKDSLQLQISNDSLDIFYKGKKPLSNLNKDFYKVSIKTTDLAENISTISPFYGYFTNVGPLVAADTIIFGYYNEWVYVQNFKFALRNIDTISAVTDVTVSISCNDKRINQMGNKFSEFNDIPTGGVSTSKNLFSFSFVNDTIRTSLSEQNPIKLQLNIYSKNRLLWIDTLNFYYLVTGIEKSDILMNTFKLYQNYPNPFNPTTSIQYSIAKRQLVTLKIFNVLGQEIETLVNEEKPAGTYELTWNAENLSSGVYFYKLRSGDFIGTKKMILLK